MFKSKISAVFCLLLFAVAFMFSGCCSQTVADANAKPKYVFLFIGDGMGPTTRQYYAHEYPDSSLETFPVTVLSGTNNVHNTTTDSAASGTAIACGIKTYNKAIGVDAQKKPVVSLAKKLRDRKYSIGIITSVGLNDATPSAHYANRHNRAEYAGILEDLYVSKFNFFAGGWIARPPKFTMDDFAAQLKKHNYHYRSEFTFDASTPTDRVVFIGSMLPDWPAAKQPRHILSEVTAYAANCLVKNPNGFFMMIEGGAIDHRNHNNDLAGAMREMREFDLAIKTALEFQKKYPKETLIIITSDHDTGGMNILGYKDASMWVKQINMAINADAKVTKRIATQSDKEVIAYLAKYFGMGELSENEYKAMVEALRIYRDPELRKKKEFRSMYGTYNPVVVQMMRLRDARTGVNWSSFSHTPRKILTNASGAGQELFKEVKENSDSPHVISRAMLGEDVLAK